MPPPPPPFPQPPSLPRVGGAPLNNCYPDLLANGPVIGIVDKVPVHRVPGVFPKRCSRLLVKLSSLFLPEADTAWKLSPICILFSNRNSKRLHTNPASPCLSFVMVWSVSVAVVGRGRWFGPARFGRGLVAPVGSFRFGRSGSARPGPGSSEICR